MVVNPKFYSLIAKIQGSVSDRINIRNIIFFLNIFVSCLRVIYFCCSFLGPSIGPDFWVVLIYLFFSKFNDNS